MCVIFFAVVVDAVNEFERESMLCEVFMLMMT